MSTGKPRTVPGPVGWNKIAQPEQFDPEIPPPAPRLSEEESHELHQSVQTMLNLRQMTQMPGWVFVQKMVELRLQNLRTQLEESDGKDDIYVKAGIRCYKEFLQIVPKYIADGEADAKRLKEDMERG